MNQTSQESNFLDITGVFLSILCAIHCTLGPLLILFLPALGGFFGNESFHLILFLAIVPVAGLTFFRCYKKHKSKMTLFLAFTAITFLFLGLIACHLLHDVLGHHNAHTAEHVLTVTGSVFIIIAHVLNIRHCRCLKKAGEAQCSH